MNIFEGTVNIFEGTVNIFEGTVNTLFVGAAYKNLPDRSVTEL